MVAMERAAQNNNEPRPAVQEPVKQDARVRQKSQEMNHLLHPSSKERTGKDYSRKVGRVLREKAIAIIEATIGRRVVHKYNTKYFEALKDDLERPNLYRWQFTPGAYDEFPDKGLSAWTLQEIKECNTALDRNLCYIVSVQDEASNSTPNPCHDRSSADSRVVLGSPERSPAPRNREKQSDNLATGLCHDFDLHVPVGHFEQFLDGLHEYRHNLEQRAQHLEQRERNFRAEIHQHKATIEKLKEDLKKRESIATGMEKFLSLLAGLEAENVNLKAQLDGLKDENAKLEGQNNEVGAQNDELNTEKDDLKGQLDQLEKKQIDFKQKFSSEKARLKAENMKLNTKQLVLEKQVYTFQRLYDKSRRFLPSCHTCDENFKRVTEFFEATLQNLPAQDWDSYTPMNETLSHIQTHHPPDEIFKLSKTAPAQNAGADLTPRSTVTTARQEKNDIFKQFGPHPTDSNDPKFPPKFPSIQAQSSKRKPTEEPQHQDPKRQRNDSKGPNIINLVPAPRNSSSNTFASASRHPYNNSITPVSRDQRPTGTHIDIDGNGRDGGKWKAPNQAGAER